jgi:hypothetical protein
MSQRIQVVLPDPAALQLRELAAGAGTPHSTLAAQLIQNELARATNGGKVRPLRCFYCLVRWAGQGTVAWALAWVPSRKAKVAAKGNPPWGQVRGRRIPLG